MKPETFTCADCGQEKPIQREGGTGYALFDLGPFEKRVCYACCAIRDRKSMIETGKAVLYLTLENERGLRPWGRVSNWPGTLKFSVLPGGVKCGRHNIAGKRYDVWFTGPDGKPWHGVTYGDMTQICRCKRTKAA